MVDKLFATFKCSGAMVITLLTANIVQANPTEYIFTAPPEIDNELAEIPNRETDYPFYECNQESENNHNEVAMDSHNCDCINCDSKAQDSEPSGQLTSQNKQNRQ